MSKTVRALVIAGGAAGGSTSTTATRPGGGGAGGYTEVLSQPISAGSYAIQVGAGGVGQWSGSSRGAHGENSSFGDLIVTTGGGGGEGSGSLAPPPGDGGSGGGGAENDTLFGLGIAGQGHNGAPGESSVGGGGGGAGATADRFDGGAGKASTITGSSVTRAGGGACGYSEATGGSGGGGGPGGDGTPNTGSGGGGEYPVSGELGGSGGSGVVIIRYVTADFGTCTGGTITTTGSDTVHTFTESGTFTVTYLPVATTQAPTEVQALGALGNGNVTDMGDDEITERGFVWGTTTQSNPGNVAPASAGYDDYVTETGTFSAGTFTGTLDGLTAATAHYVRAYARNATGYSYGDERQFVTTVAPNAASMTTQAATSVSQSGALLNGTNVDEGIAAITERGFVYGTRAVSLPGNVHPLLTGYSAYTSESGTFTEEAYDDTINGLIPATTYYARSYAKNTGGYSYGNQVSFTTIDLNSDDVASETLTNESVSAATLTNTSL